MAIKDEIRAVRAAFVPLTIYERFEYVVILVLTALISIVVIAAVWTLSLKILFGLVLSGGVDPADYSVFQAVFGMIFTVIIALEFKKSLLVATQPGGGVVQIGAVVLIALLAICRKFIILDLSKTDAPQIFALAAAALTLGVVYWMVRARDESVPKNG
ncbi:phosphate-starvation-inducible PsiE family protein [Methylopila sp. Yamaguchi]|uniref:phosphate-starvation-inducible PsiE family protein n=1 Tax=Methylopila sp. Yamaguchi TaxID=1437817 RepID=UPI000CCC8E67|nr:phosphate-starvation-inducible PsiE family protein [Methylopila sp. Yamaguchi]